MVTTHGITIPLWLWVRALNCFTNSMMFTPCGPRAVPTGGAGVAAPAGHWSFTTAWIFFAMHLLVTWARASGLLPRDPRGRGWGRTPAHLPFHPGGRAVPDRHRSYPRRSAGKPPRLTSQ